MAVPSKMQDLSTLAASNSPAGSDAIGNTLDDYIRSGFAITRSTNAISSASIASASTTDLGSSDAEAVTVTGTATITSFGTSVSGLKREVTFSGACTITNSTNIVLANGANLTTSAGDVLTFRSQGSGIWKQITASRLIGNITAPLQFLATASDATVAASSNNPTKGIIVQTEVSGASAKAAYINLIRQGVYGVNIGLDSDNQLKVGGGSLGAVSYRILHEGLAGFSIPGAITCTGLTVSGTNATLSGNSTNSVNLLFSNATSGAHNYAIGSSGGGPSANGSFFIYDTVGAARMTIDASGNAFFSVSVSSPSVFQTSDARLKDIIGDFQPRDLSGIRIAEYTWKDGGKYAVSPIAQEVAEQAPEYVHASEDGTLGVDKAGLALERVAFLEGVLRKAGLL